MGVTIWEGNKAERVATALENLARGGDAAHIDATYEAMLTGANTTHIFELWWPLSDNGDSKYARLERWFTMLGTIWSGKRYTLRYYKPSVSGSSDMTPLDDLTGKSAAQLCTEATTPVTDWADEDPMTWYVRANAKSLADGTMNITYIEGESGFDITGGDAPVWTFCLALWRRRWEDGDYLYKSWATVNHGGYTPYAGDVAPDNTKRIMTWRPTFPGGLNGSGALTSGYGRKPYIFASANAGITAARNMDAYEGIWNDADTIWALDMWQLRHFDLENSGICEGCQSYNFQYHPALAESGVTRILLTAAQAANLLVGSNVAIGEQGENTSTDRGQTYNRNIASYAKITHKETVTVEGTDYTAIYVDVDTAFDTTATTLISTMPWDAGITEALPGHKDGAYHSLTSGVAPMRVQGVELMSGAYDIGLDPIYNVTNFSDGKGDYTVYECRDSVKLAGSITSDYQATGVGYVEMPRGWNYPKSFADTEKAVLFPSELGGSTSAYFKSGFNGASSAGVRCPWRFGYLGSDGFAGLGCEGGSSAPSNAYWGGRPRLSGAGKKRGEWTA